MPSSVPVQRGTQLIIGFGSFALTGYIPEDGITWAKPREIDMVMDENDSVITLIVSRPGDEFNVDLIVKATGGSITPPAQGDTVSLTDPVGTTVTCVWMEAPTVSFARKRNKLSGKAVYWPDLSVT